jgi:hypothetical protein
MCVKANSQAFGLTQMMKNKSHNTLYVLALPLVQIQKYTLDNLAVNDVIFLEQETFKLILIYGNTVLNDIELNNDEIKISNTSAKKIITHEDNAYKILTCSFLKLQIHELIDGMTVAIEPMDFDNITLSADGEKVATGSLVKVVSGMAVNITELIV